MSISTLFCNRPCRCCEVEVPPGTPRQWSRFAHVYLCEACAAREELDGFFWRAKAEAEALALRAGV